MDMDFSKRKNDLFVHLFLMASLILLLFYCNMYINFKFWLFCFTTNMLYIKKNDFLICGDNYALYFKNNFNVRPIIYYQLSII